MERRKLKGTVKTNYHITANAEIIKSLDKSGVSYAKKASNGINASQGEIEVLRNGSKRSRLHRHRKPADKHSPEQPPKAQPSPIFAK